MNTPKIILVNGKKRSGKDYVARELKKLLETKSKTVQIMSFAEPMKSIISTTLGIAEKELELYKNNPENYKVCLVHDDEFGSNYSVLTDFRKILQQFGTECMKPHFGDDVWVNLLLDRAKNAKCDYIIVPDFRFKCEYISAYTINVQNNELQSTDQHSSENGLDNFEFMFSVDNTTTDGIHKDISLELQKIADKLY